MQKINLRELYPDVYKTDVFVDVAEEVVAAIRGQEQDDAAYERRKFRHKAHYSLNREDGIENDALNRPLTPEEVLEQKLLREEVYAALMQLTAIQALEAKTDQRRDMEMLLQAFAAQIFIKIVRIEGINRDMQPVSQIFDIHTAHQKRVVADDFRRVIFVDFIQQLFGVLHLEPFSML